MTLEKILISLLFMALNVTIAAFILENWQLRRLRQQGKSTKPGWPHHPRCSVHLNLNHTPESQGRDHELELETSK